LAARLLRAPGLRRVVGATLIVALVGWGLYSSNKDPLLIGALAALAGIGPRILRQVRGMAVGAAILALPLVGMAAPGFSLFRGGVPLSALARVAQRGLFVRTDPAGPLFSIGEAIRDHSALIWGESYVRGLVLWVPQIFWPGRPVDLAQEFAMTHISGW